LPLKISFWLRLLLRGLPPRLSILLSLAALVVGLGLLLAAAVLAGFVQLQVLPLPPGRL
jgi:hypothetical protein